MTDILKRTWAQIDLDALRFNYSQIRKNTDERAKVCCVIKADAYGHGAVTVARELEKAGAPIFAVSNLEEAFQLRHAGIEAEVLVMGYTPADKAMELCENNICQCVFSEKYALELSENAVRSECTVRVHIKVDSGMSRLGFYYQDIFRDTKCREEILRVCALPGLACEGIFTHFAVADEGSDGDRFTMRQFGCFKDMLEDLQREGIRFKTRHCANSAAILDYPGIHMDMVRAGLLCYGLFPSRDVRNRPELKPVLELKSIVSQIHDIDKGATISYGREFTAQRPMRIATVPIGYADGYPRILARAGASVLINGILCPIVGRICMDYLMADITDAGEVHEEDTVTLIGKDGDREITADEIAAMGETISYEIICNIGKRVPRVYLRHGKTVSVTNVILPWEEDV